MAEEKIEKKEVTEKNEIEENVMSPKEFQKLEEKEGNKETLDIMKKEPKKDDSEKKEKGIGDASIGSLTLKIEKLEGKIETMADLRNAVDERFSRVSEEIGELRSSILEKDRAFDKVEKGFQIVEEIIHELEPRKLRKELDKKTEEIIKNQARSEGLATQIESMSKGVKELRDLLGRIKDVKNIVNLSNDMSITLTKVEKERRTINKTAGKIEAIFSELSKKVSEFDSYKDKVDFNAETMHDLMKSLDMLEIKLENMVKKDDMTKYDEKIKNLDTELKDRVHDIKEIVNLLVSSLRKTNLKEIIDKQGIESVSDVNQRISELQSKIGAMEILGKGLEVAGRDIEDLKKGMIFVKGNMGTVKREVETRPVEEEVKIKQKTEEEVDVRKALSDMINYVRSTLKLGYTSKQIKSELLKKGWPKRTVNEIILREVVRKRKEAFNRVEYEPKKGEEYEPKKDAKKMLVSLSPQY